MTVAVETVHAEGSKPTYGGRQRGGSRVRMGEVAPSVNL